MANPVIVNDPNALNFPARSDLGTGFGSGVRVGTFQHADYMGGNPGTIDLPQNGLLITPLDSQPGVLFNGPINFAGQFLNLVPKPPFTVLEDVFVPIENRVVRCMRFDCVRNVRIDTGLNVIDLRFKIWGLDGWNNPVSETIIQPTQAGTHAIGKKTYKYIMAIQALDFPDVPYPVEAGTLNVFGLPFFLGSPGYATMGTYSSTNMLSVPYVSTLTPISFGGGSTAAVYSPWLVTVGDTTTPATAVTGDTRGTITLYNAGNPIYGNAFVPAPNGVLPLNYIYYVAGCANNGVSSVDTNGRNAVLGMPQYYEPLPAGA